MRGGGQWSRKRASSKVAENLIEIRVNDIAQLFHTLDPFPFREKDLADEAEDYIVSWAREMPGNRPFKIVVHIPDNESQKRASRDLVEAFNRYFAGRAVVVQRDLNELFRIGRRSLLIGASILAACFLLAHLAGSYLTETAFKRLAEESFLILGWVANWRPLEIFLYDWWPLAHRRDLYNRLSVATVEFKAILDQYRDAIPPSTHRSNPIMRSGAAASESQRPFRGLSEADAQARLKAEGYNELPRPDRRTPFRIVVEVLREPMLALLLGGGVIYLALGDLKEALILLAFATMSVVITVVQETRTERVLEALRDLTSPRALVIRDGERKRIAGREVVRGDLIVLAEGDRVPADAVLLRVPRSADRRIAADGRIRARAQDRAGRSRRSRARRPGGDDLPYVFSGSLVVRGTGIGEVIAIGAAKRDRQDRPVAQHARDRAAAPAGADPPPRAAVRHCRRRGQRAGGAALRHLARRLARRGARRHRARHVDAARRSFRSC